MDLKQRSHHDKGHARKDIGHALEDEIDGAAVISLYRAVNRADDKVDEGNADRQHKAQLNAVGHTERQIVALAVRAENIVGLEPVYIAIIIVIQHADSVLCGFRRSASRISEIHGISRFVAQVVVLENHILAVRNDRRRSRRLVYAYRIPSRI